MKEAQDEAKDLRDKLKLYQTIDAMVKGSNADVNNRLHDVGDFSQASRELSIIIVALKRELTSTVTKKIMGMHYSVLFNLLCCL